MQGRSTGDGDAQEGCRNRRGAFDLAGVLALEEGRELRLELRAFAVLFCGGKRVHRGAVVVLDVYRSCARRCSRSGSIAVRRFTASAACVVGRASAACSTVIMNSSFCCSPTSVSSFGSTALMLS
jgi:hypothetical protein